MAPPNPVYQLKAHKRIADPVHGLIRLTELESKVLQTPIFQRLRHITQLGMASSVYPGATHSRFTHSLGVVHNATAMFDVAYKNWMRSPDQCGDIDADLLFSEEMLQITRLAAMCHDLGHLPFSHNLEIALDWLAKENYLPHSFRHEQLSEVMIKELLGPTLGDLTNVVSGLIVNDYTELGSCLFPAFLVSSAIDADRMDYLVRDALYSGVDQGRYDRERLLDSVIPYRTQINDQPVDVLGFKSKGIESVEQFLLARHRMHQTIYFNPSVVGFEAGLRRAYYRISTDDPPWELPHVYLEEPEKFIDFDESMFWRQLKSELTDRESWLMDPLLNRNPLKKYGPFYYTLNPHASSNDEIFSLLKTKQLELEDPSNDWKGKDHWVYVENKRQVLVDPLPQSLSGEQESFEDASSLKNVVILVSAKGNLIDPTDASFGHTFLPHITDQVYHRFLFYSHKKDQDRLRTELQEILPMYEDFVIHNPKDLA